MSKLQRCAMLALALSLILRPAAWASAYDAHPKIVIVLVIDQFRADYLERYSADFKGRGFRLFLDHGAYFSSCYYGYANTKTAPGHATIGTGAYTDGHGIGSNEWWDLDRNKQHPVSSVEDERYAIVGLAAPPGGSVPGSAPVSGAAAAPAAGAANGASPRNLLASTVGDELRLATGGTAAVWGISLKDRAAILPAGAAANGAFWIDPASGRFITSTYYMQQLPPWAEAFNGGPAIATAEAAAQTNAAGETNAATPVTSFYEQVGRTPAANGYELAFAEALIAGEQLGQHPATDMVTISLSANDILGHQVGPDSPEERAMVDALDTSLDAFFTWLDKNIVGGLGNVWIALTADHGVAPAPAVSSALGLQGAYLDVKQLIANLNQAINQKFSPGENQVYLLPQQELPYLSLNEPAFSRAGINEQEAEQAVQAAVEGAVAALGKPGDAPSPAVAKIKPQPRLFRTYTRQQLAVSGELPSTEFGHLLAHSYTPNGGWYVMVLPVAYQMGGYGNDSGTTHYSPFSYDRHVPLGFYGAPFVPGIYPGRVQPVDLAATLASLLGINQPSASVGEVLTQALKPAGSVVYPKEPLPAAKGKGRSRRRVPAKPEAQSPAAAETHPQ